MSTPSEAEVAAGVGAVQVWGMKSQGMAPDSYGAYRKAKHEAWKHQLRDRLGQWIDMGTGVRWFASGKAKQGTVVGSPDAKTAIVEEAGGNRLRIAASRLTAAFEAPSGSWVHTPPDDPTELVVRAHKARKIALAVPESEAKKAKVVAPAIPKNLADLSDRKLEALYWETRDHPKVGLFQWMRIALEVQKRKIDLDPHAGGFFPAGALASGAPEDKPLDVVLQQMEARIIQRTLAG
jgi:hypothetical protein